MRGSLTMPRHVSQPPPHQTSARFARPSTAPVVAPGEDGLGRRPPGLEPHRRPAPGRGRVRRERRPTWRPIVNFARERRAARGGAGHRPRGAGARARSTTWCCSRRSGCAASRVDAGARRARVEAGALGGDLGPAAGEHGLAAARGSSPDVGVVGFALGGGIGWLSRRHGLACNSDHRRRAGHRRRRAACAPTPIRTPTCSGRCAEAAATSAWSPRSSSSCSRSATVYAGSLMWPGRARSGRHARLPRVARTIPDELTTGDPLSQPAADPGGARAAARRAGRRRDRGVRRRRRRRARPCWSRCARWPTPIIDGWAEMPGGGPVAHQRRPGAARARADASRGASAS